ncbi:hypothetical protein E4T56_gene20938, partial [Termitomyces sp. T112]
GTGRGFFSSLFDVGALGFEHLAVGFVGAQRLLVGQQEVTGVTVLHGDDVTDVAQLLDTFEENDLHGFSPLLHEVGQQAQMTGALDRLTQFTLLLGGNGGDAAGNDLATFGHEALKQADVLIVDLGSVLAREGAALAATEKCTSHGSSLLAFAATAALAIVLAHLDRGTSFQFIDANGDEADDVLVDADLTLQLGGDAGGGFNVEHHKVSLAVALDLVGEVLETPGFGLGDLAPVGFNDLGGGGGQRINLRLAQILAGQEHVLIESHGSFLFIH